MTNSQLTQKHTSPQHQVMTVSGTNKKTNMNKKSNKNNQQMTAKDGNDMNRTLLNNKKNKKKQPTVIVESTDKVMNVKSPQQQHQHQRRNTIPVKVRRMERKKDIVSMTDALESSQADLLSSSPPVSLSATESEDSDPGRVNRRRNNNKKPSLGNDTVFPPLMNHQQQTNNKKSGSTGRRQQHHQGNKIVYAGPTFNNAPAPSSLPIPPPTLNNNNTNNVHEDVFYMEVVPSRPVYHQPDFQQQSRDLMNLLTPRYVSPPPPPPPMMPTMMNYPPRNHTLSQIQRDLRSMLKLEVAS